MVKLICSDVDGTLLNEQRQVDDYTIKVFKNLNKNVQTILASSRMPAALWHIQKTLSVENMPLICYNGALVLASGKTFDSKKIIASVTIPAALTNHIVLLASQYNIHVSLYQDNTWLASALDFYAEREINNTHVRPDGLIEDLTFSDLNNFINQGAHKIMVMGKPEILDLIEIALNGEPELALWRSKDIYLEISPRTNKMEGLLALLSFLPEYADITLENVMSFGDNYNDLELIKGVKYGIAVGNSVTQLKSVAYEIAKTNVEHGVAFYLENFLQMQDK